LFGPYQSSALDLVVAQFRDLVPQVSAVTLDPKDRAWMLARYDARLAQFGDDIRTLGSGTVERRRLRFDVLRQVGISDGCSVLDLGCGFGDFFGYLVDAGMNVSYLGVDINPKLLDVARQKYPAGAFRVADFLSDPFEPVDFVVASGTFNLALRAGDNYDYAGRMLRRAYDLARRGVAMDFHTADVDYRVDDVFYYEPQRVFAIARSVTKRVALRHDYPLYEFCVYLYPDFAGWGARAGEAAP
jgi:SAM-dependent methyltransferase